MRVMPTLFCVAILLAGASSALASGGTCMLQPLSVQLRLPSVYQGDMQSSELAYRRQLLRFTKGFYGALAQDILRGEGEYLSTLKQLMGSDGDACLYTYRQLLLKETSGEDFALALWMWRTENVAAMPTQVTTTMPVQDWGVVTVDHE